jgi:hypothetical protein
VGAASLIQKTIEVMLNNGTQKEAAQPLKKRDRAVGATTRLLPNTNQRARANHLEVIMDDKLQSMIIVWCQVRSA